jgi:hypothetical protein
MGVLKPCVPYCFLLLPLATNQLFLLLFLYIASRYGQIFAKVFLSMTYICSYKMPTKKNTVQKQIQGINIANDISMI